MTWRYDSVLEVHIPAAICPNSQRFELCVHLLVIDGHTAVFLLLQTDSSLT